MKPLRTTCLALQVLARTVAASKPAEEAASLLGLTLETLKRHRRRYRELWTRLLAKARRDAEREGTSPPPARPRKQKRPPGKITPETRAVVTTAARLTVLGCLLSDAARMIGMRAATLRRYRSQHHAIWDEALAEATERQAAGHQITINVPTPFSKVSRPRPQTVDAMRRAAAMLAAGATHAEVAKALKRRPSIVDYWKKKYPDPWQAAYDAAIQSALIIVRHAAGTDRVDTDPERHIRQALACHRWAARRGEEFFPQPSEITLSQFYFTYYEPICLADAAPITIRGYRRVVKHWQAITGDPPLAEITVELVAHFRDCVKKLRGQQPGSTISANSVRNYLTHLYALFNKAGPAGPRNRDAAELIKRVPWARPPRPEIHAPKVPTLDVVAQAYAAADAMDVPRVPGLAPMLWWQGLLVVAYCSGLRRGALFALRFDHVHWRRRRLEIPPALSKTNRGQNIHLNAVALAHLLRIRGPRELVFPWDHGESYFHRAIHALQDAADIPRADHFGLQQLRGLHGTLLWETSPEAAQAALAHTTIRTTRNHYLAGDAIMARALEALPNPFKGVA